MAIAYDEDHDEYRKQLGLIGVQLMNLSGDMRDEYDYRNFSQNHNRGYRDDRDEPDMWNDDRYMRSLVSYDSSNQDFIDMFEDADHYDSLVDKLRGETITVKISDVFEDLIQPLSDRLYMIGLEFEEREAMRHHELGMYLDKLLKGINNLDSRTVENRGIFLALREYLRHPWLYLGRGLVSVVSGIVSTGFGALFGRKKKESDTDRIVNAINRQTEWHMDNAISQKKGFFDRLKAQGILGMSVRGIGNLGMKAIGVNKDLAQNREDQASRGETLTGGWRGKLSSKLYGDTVDLKGRPKHPTMILPHKPPFPVHDEKVYDVLLDMYLDTLDHDSSDLTVQNEILIEMKKFTNIFRNGIDFSSMQISVDSACPGDCINDILRKDLNALVSSIESASNRPCANDCIGDAIRQQTATQRKYYAASDRFNQHEARLEYARQRIEDRRYESDINRKRKELEMMSENSDIFSSLDDNISDVSKHTKQTKDEVKKSRLQNMWSSVLGFGTKLVSGIASVVAGIAGLAVALLPMKAIGGMLASLGSKIVAGFAAAIASMKAGDGISVGGDGGKKGKKGKKGFDIPSVGKLTIGGLATSIGLSAISSQLEEGSVAAGSMGVLESMLSGASVGGIAGGFIGGVSAIPGAIIGGAGGLAYGLYSNREALFGDKKEEPSQLVTPVISEKDLQPKTDNTIEAIKNNTKEGISTPPETNASLIEKIKTEYGVDAKIENAKNIVSPFVNEAVTKFSEMTSSSNQVLSATRDELSSVVENAKYDVRSVGADVRIIADTARRETVNFGRSVSEYANEKMDVLAPKFDAIQSVMEVQIDAIRDVYEGMKQQSIETLNALKENNKQGKEMIDILKGILSNTKTEPNETSPLSDYSDSGFFKHMIGR